MWFAFNKEYQPVGILDNDIPNGCPILSDNHASKLENGFTQLQFTVPSNNETADLLETEGFIVYTNKFKGYELFRIVEIVETHGEDMQKVIYCDPAHIKDLRGTIVRPKTFTSANLSTVMEFLLSQTDWDLGETFYDDLVSIEFTDYPTTLEAILATVAVFDADIEFKVEMRGTKIERKVVNVYDKIGEITGVRMEYPTNLMGVTRKESSADVVTALIGIGGEDANGKQISIVDAQIVAPNGYEKVDDYVGDTNALANFGNNGQHVFGTFKDDTATNPVELFNNTLAELKKRVSAMTTPTYEVEVAFLEQLDGYDHLRIGVGDTILIVDTTFKPTLYLQARVLEKETSITQIDTGKVVLGEFLIRKVSDIASVKKMQRTIVMKEKKWDLAKAIADRAEAKATEFADKIETRIEGVETFRNGQGQNTYVATLWQNGVEIDTQGILYNYVWTMYDNAHQQIKGFAKTGKTITVSASEINKQCIIKCDVHQ